MVRMIKQNQSYKGFFDSHCNLKVMVCVISALDQWPGTSCRDQTPHTPVPRSGVVSEKLSLNKLCYCIRKSFGKGGSVALDIFAAGAVEDSLARYGHVQSDFL